MNTNKILSTTSISGVFMLSLLTLFILSGIAYSEDAHTAFDSDQVIKGKMDDFSQTMIIVNGRQYSLCKDIMVFNLANKLIKLNDIEGAVEVELFRTTTCIRKIAALSYAQ